MRMHMIRPDLLCMQHLVGEHSEIHKHTPGLEKGYDITKRFLDGQISLPDLKSRHDALASEIDRRAKKRGDTKGGHKSPYDVDMKALLNCSIFENKIDDIEKFSMPHALKIKNFINLLENCKECRKRMIKVLNII